MTKFLVCKKVVPYGQGKVRYLLFYPNPAQGWRQFGSIAEIVAHLKKNSGRTEELHIKNETPADIVWKRDDTVEDLILECERLTRSEMRSLVLLLKQG